MARFRRKTCIRLIGLILCTFLIMIFLKSLRPEGTSFGNPFGLGLFPHLSRLESGKTKIHIQEDTAATRGGSTNIHKNTARGGMHFEAKPEDLPVPNYNLHVFYYNWYGNPQFDGKYIHWDHPLLPHWDSKVASSFPRGRHSPPDDIGSNFYPELGAYSSRDPSVIEAHVLQLRTAAVVYSYKPHNRTQERGSANSLLPFGGF